MADAANLPGVLAVPTHTVPGRHSLVVRTAHWLVTLAFFALLLTGVEILISHPCLYWGEAGNIWTRPLISFPIPASRASVPTGYRYVLPDQNGWSRYLHFQSAWLLVLTGLVYVAYAWIVGHFSRHLSVPATAFTWRGLLREIKSHSRLRPTQTGVTEYNTIQRLTYLLVIFGLFPFVIWTGLAMSPAIASVFPGAVSILGGQQSARTLHFFVSVALVLFLFVHVLMICLNGFRKRMRSMVMGSLRREREF